MNVRIYAVADIHGKRDRLERIEHHIKAVRPHVLVVAGDITNYVSPVQTLSRIDALPVPVFAIRGNSDFKRVDHLIHHFQNITSIHAHRIIRHSIPFVGIGGTIPIPFHSKVHLNEATLLNRVAPCIDRETILVVHPPPRGVLDTAFGYFHVGSSGVRRFIERHQPRLVICGHVHECTGVDAISETFVVNCSMGRNNSGVLIDDNPGNGLKITMI
jgi:Icc-related predicted phosphoesterase